MASVMVCQQSYALNFLPGARIKYKKAVEVPNGTPTPDLEYVALGTCDPHANPYEDGDKLADPKSVTGTIPTQTCVGQNIFQQILCDPGLAASANDPSKPQWLQSCDALGMSAGVPFKVGVEFDPSQPPFQPDGSAWPGLLSAPLGPPSLPSEYLPNLSDPTHIPAKFYDVNGNEYDHSTKNCGAGLLCINGQPIQLALPDPDNPGRIIPGGMIYESYENVEFTGLKPSVFSAGEEGCNHLGEWGVRSQGELRYLPAIAGLSCASPPTQVMEPYQLHKHYTLGGPGVDASCNAITVSPGMLMYEEDIYGVCNPVYYDIGDPIFDPATGDFMVAIGSTITAIPGAQTYTSQPGSLYALAFPGTDKSLIRQVQVLNSKTVDIGIGESKVIHPTSQMSFEVRYEKGKACVYAYGPDKSIEWRVRAEYPQTLAQVQGQSQFPSQDCPTGNVCKDNVCVAIDHTDPEAVSVSGGACYVGETDSPSLNGQTDIEDYAHCVNAPPPVYVVNSLAWSSVIDDSCTDYSTAHSHADNAFTSVVTECVEMTMWNMFFPTGNHESSFFLRMQETLLALLRAALSLYIIIQGYRLMVGSKKLPARGDWAWYVIKIGLVVWFSLGNGLLWLFPKLVAVSKGLSLILMQAGLGVVANETVLEAQATSAAAASNARNAQAQYEMSLIELSQLQSQKNLLEAQKDGMENTVESMEQQLENIQDQLDAMALDPSTPQISANQYEFLEALQAAMACSKDPASVGFANCYAVAGCSVPGPGFGGSFTELEALCSSTLAGESNPITPQQRFMAAMVEAMQDPNTSGTLNSAQLSAANAGLLEGEPNPIGSAYAALSSNQQEYIDDVNSAMNCRQGSGGSSAYASCFTDLGCNAPGSGFYGSVEQVKQLCAPNLSGEEEPSSAAWFDAAVANFDAAASAYSAAVSNYNNALSALEETEPFGCPPSTSSYEPMYEVKPHPYFQPAFGFGGFDICDFVDCNAPPPPPPAPDPEPEPEPAPPPCTPDVPEPLTWDDVADHTSEPSIAALIAAEQAVSSSALNLYNAGWNNPSAILPPVLVAPADPSEIATPSYGFDVSSIASSGLAAGGKKDGIGNMAGGINLMFKDMFADFSEFGRLQSEKAQIQENIDAIEGPGGEIAAIDVQIAAMQAQIDALDTDALKDSWDDMQAIADDMYEAMWAAIESEAGSGELIENATGYNYCDFRFFRYDEGYEFKQLWDMVDCKISKYLGIGSNPSNASVPQVLWLGMLSVISSSFGIPIFILSMIIVPFIVMVTYRIVHIYLMAFISLVLLVYVGPIAIITALFDQFKEVYQTWQRLVMSFVLQPVILFGFLAFLFAVMDTVVYGGNYNFDVNNNIVGEDGSRVSPVNKSCEDMSAIGCIYETVATDEKYVFFLTDIGMDINVARFTGDQDKDLFFGLLKLALVCFIAFYMLQPVEQLSSQLTDGMAANAAALSRMPVFSPSQTMGMIGSVAYNAQKAAVGVPGRIIQKGIQHTPERRKNREARQLRRADRRAKRRGEPLPSDGIKDKNKLTPEQQAAQRSSANPFIMEGENDKGPKGVTGKQAVQISSSDTGGASGAAQGSSASSGAGGQGGGGLSSRSTDANKGTTNANDIGGRDLAKEQKSKFAKFKASAQKLDGETGTGGKKGSGGPKDKVARKGPNTSGKPTGGVDLGGDSSGGDDSSEA